MNYRSTNASGRYTHLGGALVVGAEFGSGIELNPNSSGSVPNITAAGDETNKGLTIMGKGSGALTLGSTTAVTNIVGSSIVFGSSAGATIGSTLALTSVIGSSITIISSGGLTVGSSIGPVTIGGSSLTFNSTGGIQVGPASTTPILLMQRYLVQATVPALSSASSAESTVTVSGLTTNSCLFLSPRAKLNSTVTGVFATARCSTADELTIEFHNCSQSSLSGSTQSWYLFQISF